MAINTPPTLDLPPELQQLMQMDSTMGHPAEKMEPVPQPNPTMPNYAAGGLVGPGGNPVPQGMPMSGMALGAQPQPDETPITMQDVDMFMESNPQAVQQMAGELQMMVETGEVSPQQLAMGANLAIAALNDPSTYPQLRQFAIQQGLVEAEDMPEQMDEAALFTIILAAKSIGADTSMQQQKMDQGPANMKDGGIVTAGSNGSGGGTVAGAGTGTSDSVPINVSAGEYVIPAHVVEMKGREFFDKMLENYNPGQDKK